VSQALTLVLTIRFFGCTFCYCLFSIFRLARRWRLRGLGFNPMADSFFLFFYDT